MQYKEELKVAKAAARKAGEIMQDYRENGFSLERKSAYTDIVTEADVACQDAIITRLHEAFPDDGFVAEEGFDQLEIAVKTPPDSSSGRCWVIDPIDGTKNFAHGFPHYCSSIALKEDGETVVGVVYAPVQDELFSAVKGEGSFLSGNEIAVSDVDDLRDALNIARLSDWDNEHVVERENTFLRALLRVPSSFRRPGAAALDLCFVACCRADGYVQVTIHEWDIAAGSLILEEAGGTARVQNAVFDPYLEIVASNGGIQKKLAKIFDEHVRE